MANLAFDGVVYALEIDESSADGTKISMELVAIHCWYYYPKTKLDQVYNLTIIDNGGRDA